MRNPISILAGWLVWSAPFPCGRLTPWLFGLSIGRWPRQRRRLPGVEIESKQKWEIWIMRPHRRVFRNIEAGGVFVNVKEVPW